MEIDMISFPFRRQQPLVEQKKERRKKRKRSRNSRKMRGKKKKQKFSKCNSRKRKKEKEKREIFGVSSGNKRKKGRRFYHHLFGFQGSNIVRKEEVFGLVFSSQSELELQERRFFSYSWTTTVARLGFSLWQRLRGGFFFYSQFSSLFLIFSLFQRMISLFNLNYSGYIMSS